MQKAFQTIEKYHMIQPGDRVLAGVSGGGRFGLPAVYTAGIPEKGEL
ncbi:MAG: hypothetical protein V8T31_09810 [Lachnospiraceae bacterium]